MWIWILATLAAYFIKGLCGFANTLVFTSILAFGTTNVNISPVELLLSYPANLLLALKNRGKLNRRVYIPLSLLVICGSIPGAFLLKRLDPGCIKAVFGFVIILLGIEMALREANTLRFKESKPVLGIIGILSGILCGLFGIGALLAAYVGRVSGDSDEFKANINAVFFAENTFRIILYSTMGIITLHSMKQVLILLPLMLAGLFLGNKSSELLQEKTVKKLVIVLLIFSGCMMILRNI